MTPEVTVTPIHDAEGLQQLRNALPGLRAMSDDKAVDALAELYALGVKAILDEFVAARCVVKGGPNPTVQH